MDPSSLEELGLTVRQTGDGAEAVLELVSVPLVNPLTRTFINSASFTVLGERLIAIDPPELVGLPPISWTGFTRGGELEAQLHEDFNEHVMQLQRRSRELQSLGLEPRVAPQTLQLTTSLAAGRHQFLLSADKRGNFRVAGARRAGTELDVSAGHTVELSEFRERSALEGYLLALFGAELEAPAQAPTLGPAPGQARPVTFAELGEAFGGLAIVPPRSSLDVLVELRAGGDTYRFAAARVAGRTFRGLLAGSKGKLWAERFVLEEFPGVLALTASILGVEASEVELVGAPRTGGEGG